MKTAQSDIEALLGSVPEEGGFDRLNHRKRPAQPPHRWSADYVLRNLENGNGRANFTVDKITVFAVNVTNAKDNNVSGEQETISDVKDLVMPDKSLNALMLCKDRPLTKKEILVGVGVTNQTVNVRNIINPLISAGCLAIVDEDREKVRNVRYMVTDRGREYLDCRSSLNLEESQQNETLEDGDELQLFPDY